ncbi:hypothetical protein BJV78DRAFT_1178490 [Lactifluus subvellereus]|nr:hypothetical protein BJV78DRAFT_1178490 [Lactifluus subvellereus]
MAAPILKARSPKKRKEKEKVVLPDAEAAVGISMHNEGVDPSLAYTPPSGSVPADYDVEFGEFDYDAVKADEDAELWLVRVPTAVKSKSLQGVNISSRLGLVGDLQRKSASYDLYALKPTLDASGNGDHDHDNAEEDAAAAHVDVGAEELSSLSVLLPRKRKGGMLYLSPKPVTRHLVVAARPPKPTRPDPGSDSATFINPPREAYPEAALTHRFRPYGDPGDPPPEDHRDIEPAEVSTKEKVKRKRKEGESMSPKNLKAKKAKTGI